MGIQGAFASSTVCILILKNTNVLIESISGIAVDGRLENNVGFMRGLNKLFLKISLFIFKVNYCSNIG